MTKTISSLSDDEINELMDIHLALSPEFLTADGELPQSLVKRRYADLMNELEAACMRMGIELAEEDVVWDEWERRGRPARLLVRAS